MLAFLPPLTVLVSYMPPRVSSGTALLPPPLHLPFLYVPLPNLLHTLTCLGARLRPSLAVGQNLTTHGFCNIRIITVYVLLVPSLWMRQHNTLLGLTSPPAPLSSYSFPLTYFHLHLFQSHFTLFLPLRHSLTLVSFPHTQPFTHLAVLSLMNYLTFLHYSSLHYSYSSSLTQLLHHSSSHLYTFFVSSYSP